MNDLEAVINDLNAFFSDSENFITEAPEEEKKINKKEAELLSDEDASLTILCARIRYGDRCGFASTGRKAFVVNARNDRRVRATVRVKWRQGINNGQYDRVHLIPAGSEKYLGCTRSNNIPVREYSYGVVGCEVL